MAFAVEQQAGRPTVRQVLTIGAAPDAPGTRIENPGAGIPADVARKIVEDIQARIDADDVAFFQLSGGTTGVRSLRP